VSKFTVAGGGRKEAMLAAFKTPSESQLFDRCPKATYSGRMVNGAEQVKDRIGHGVPLVFILVLGLAGILARSASGGEYFVAPHGDDGGPGTREKPFASICRARDRIREIKRGGPLKEPVTIVVCAGTYYLTEPLVLAPEDSGTSDCPITYMAAPSEDVLLSGGEMIAGPWRSENGQVFCTDLPEIRDSGVPWEQYKKAERERQPLPKRWHFRQLFVNDQWQVRARFPNADAKDPYLYAPSPTTEPFMPAPKGSARSVWGTSPDAQIWANIDWNGYNLICDITSVDSAADRIHVFDPTGRWRVSGDPDPKRAYDKPDWFYVEGIRDELDEPGEWYLDPVAGRLWYWSPDGTMKGKTVVAPRLDAVIVLSGDPKAGTHVDHVRFRNLKVAHTRYSLGHPEPRVSIDGAVIFRNARHCRIENCEIYNVGGNAIWLQYDCQDNTISGNYLHDLGSAGVQTTGARLAWMQDESVLNPDRATWKYSPLGTVVTHNRIQNCSRIYVYGPGVFIDSAPMRLRYKKHAYIAHNEIDDVGKKAVFLFTNVGQTVVEYNQAKRCGWRVRDTGVYYTVCNNDENGDQLYFLNNAGTDISARFDGRYGGRCTYGLLYVDHASHLVHMENNVLEGELSGPRGGKLIHQNLLNGQTPKNPTFGGNIWNEEPHAGIDRGNIGCDSHASNNVQIEEDLGVAVEWWEQDQLMKRGDWQEYLQATAGWTPLGGVIKTSTRQLRYTGSGSPDHWIEFNTPVPRSGVYRAFVYFKHDDPNAATNVPVVIQHTGGTSTAFLNQRKQYAHDNARWHGYPVGVYQFEAGQGRIRIGTERVNGAVYISGVALVRPKFYFCDDDGPDVLKEGAWKPGGKQGFGAHYGNGYVVCQAGDPNARVVYPFSNILEATRYDVYLWHKHGGPAASSRTRVAIYHGGQTDTVIVDMRSDGSRWRHLGRFFFDKAVGQSVTIHTMGADGSVIADAVKLVKVADDVGQIAQQRSALPDP
jgi:parallel beta-helix repeat protein